jgi:glycosyltransferase involved in cell wall biosynthesis
VREEAAVTGPNRTKAVGHAQQSGSAPVVVVHLLATGRHEGESVASFVRGLAEHAGSTRYRLAAWFLIEDGPLRDELSLLGVDARFVPWRGRRDPRGGARAVSDLCRAKAAIVHRHTGGRAVGWLTRAATSASVVGHVHSTANEGHTRRLNTVTAGAHIVVANSGSAARATGLSGVRVINPGVPVGQFPVRPAPPAGAGDGGAFVIGTACRLVPLKGLAHLLDAFVAVRDQFPNTRLEIAGDGPDRQRLEAQTRRLGLAEHVRFLGWCADLPSTFASWSVFVQPSLSEGFGLSALEAMAASLPVVATAVGGVPELVEQGTTGLLVPAGDSESLADALLEVLQSSDGGRTMGLAGRARAQRSFTTETMARQTFDLYDELVAARGRSLGRPSRYGVDAR